MGRRRTLVVMLAAANPSKSSHSHMMRASASSKAQLRVRRCGSGVRKYVAEEEAEVGPPSPQRPMYDESGRPVRESPRSGQRRLVQKTHSGDFPPWE